MPDTKRLVVYSSDHQLTKDIKHELEKELGKCVPVADIVSEALRLYIDARENKGASNETK